MADQGFMVLPKAVVCLGSEDVFSKLDEEQLDSSVSTPSSKTPVVSTSCHLPDVGPSATLAVAI